MRLLSYISYGSIAYIYAMNYNNINMNYNNINKRITYALIYVKVFGVARPPRRSKGGVCNRYATCMHVIKPNPAEVGALRLRFLNIWIYCIFSYIYILYYMASSIETSIHIYTCIWICNIYMCVGGYIYCIKGYMYISIFIYRYISIYYI